MNQYSQTDLQLFMSGNPMQNKHKMNLPLWFIIYSKIQRYLTLIQDLGAKFTSGQINHHYEIKSRNRY